MADIYNIATQAYQQGRQRAQDQRLNELARLAIAKPSQQMAIASQMAAVNPQAGFALAQQVQQRQGAEQEAMAAEQEKRRAGAANFARYLGSIRDPQQRQQIAQVYAPKFGDQFPQDLSDEGLAAFSAFALGPQEQNQARVQSTQVLADGSIALVMSDGSIRRSGEQAQAPFSVQEFRNPDGSVSYARIPTRSFGAGGVYGGQQPQSRIEIAPGAEPIPPEVLQGFERAMQSGQPFNMQVPARGGSGFGQTDQDRAQAAAEQARLVEQAKIRGTREASAIADAPQAARQAEALISQIDSILEDDRLAIATGASGVLDPRAWPIISRSTGVSDVVAKINQVQGSAFLEAFEKLKGGGAITEIEGKKAEQAIARLSVEQSDEGFRQALEDFRAAIEPALERARARIEQGQQQVKQVRRTGTLNGRRVIEYTDGSVEYGD